MADSYARVGPPFNFLGHMSESQKDAFKGWIDSKQGNFAPIQQHHQIRAQQLRKTAGLLEQYYQQYHEESLAPTFRKETWQPGPDGHFNYNYRDDHAPSMTVSKIKDNHREMLNRQDDAVFAMNHIRSMIEAYEDNAQQASESSGVVATLLQNLENMFSEPQYQAVLVKDKTDLFEGVARFRTSPLDPPTPWELTVANRTYQSPTK